MRSAVTQGGVYFTTSQQHQQRITLFAYQCMMHAMIETPRHSLVSFSLSFSSIRLHFFSFFLRLPLEFISYYFNSFPLVLCPLLHITFGPFGRVLFDCFLQVKKNQRQKGIRTGDPTRDHSYFCVLPYHPLRICAFGHVYPYMHEYFRP